MPLGGSCDKRGPVVGLQMKPKTEHRLISGATRVCPESADGEAVRRSKSDQEPGFSAPCNVTLSHIRLGGPIQPAPQTKQLSWETAQESMDR